MRLCFACFEIDLSSYELQPLTLLENSRQSIFDNSRSVGKNLDIFDFGKLFILGTACKVEMYGFYVQVTYIRIHIMQTSSQNTIEYCILLRIARSCQQLTFLNCLNQSTQNHLKNHSLELQQRIVAFQEIENSVQAKLKKS